MSWNALFERAESKNVSLKSIRETLSERRKR